MDGNEIQRVAGQWVGWQPFTSDKTGRAAASVAVKVLHPHVAPESDSHARFEREARLMRSLADSHFVQVTDFGKTGTQPFLVMEYVEAAR